MRPALLFLALFTASFAYCEEKPSILVSVPVYCEIVQKLVGDVASVHSLIPPDVDCHTYEPQPQDIEKAFSCFLWFSVMDPFEERFAEAASSHNLAIQRINLHTNLPMIASSCCAKAKDPHIWLDPRLMLIQINTIAETLQKAFPEHKKAISERLIQLQDRMLLLINQVDTLLKPMKGKVIVVAHGAYTYLCEQYGIEQLSLELEGKEPSLAQFLTLIQKAKKLHVKTIFSLKQFSKSSIEKAAALLEARIIELDPYLENYFENILFTAQSFHNALKEESYD